MASININYLCLGCMNTLPHPKAVCPVCGWSSQSSKNNASQLNQGVTLTNPTNGNVYLIGKAAGHGGFGIVYVAFDITNNRKVAIKEYFPSQFVDRDNSTKTVIPKNDNQANRSFLAKQKKRFYQEAEKMLLFKDSPNVVNVLDYFETNNTAYIVMEFINGLTFAEVLDNTPNKRLTLQDVLANLNPIINILERIHQTPYIDDKGTQHTGITHRDISPENIMYADDGTVKLLDFGAARVSEPGDPPTGIIKPGYAPLEQQLSVKGPDSAQGSWTDVYALAATIYRAITGQIPPNALSRLGNDTLIPPSAMGIQITPKEEQVLLKGLAVKYQDRYQSVSKFYNDLITPIIVTKSMPTLAISQFTKNGNAYSAFITYNGDGILTSSIGIINGNNLSITGTNGNFNGIITASEGANYLATSLPFSHQENHEEKENIWKKIIWAVAVVTVIAALLILNKVKAHEIELSNIQEHIQSNETNLEKYRDFASDYGYASASYHAEKAIVFVKRNSTVRFYIYCNLKDADEKVTLHYDKSDPINVEWDSAPFDENHKAAIIVQANNKPVYSTIKFSNKDNSDSFNVLVVVQ